MKTLMLIVLLLLVPNGWADEKRKAHIAAFRADLLAHVEKQKAGKPQDWVVTDTGDSVNLGEGDSPVVEVYRKDLPHACLQAIHPADPKLSAQMICYPREPEVEVKQ
jgi:hypothetical protein